MYNVRNVVAVRKVCSHVWLAALTAMVLLAGGRPAFAATLCVKSGGGSGCFSSIQAAVSGAAAYDTVEVAKGTYHEMVTIGKPLSLVGEGEETTIIDAAGLATGIYIDGIDNPGLTRVVVTGFTVQGATYEGILVANASHVTIWGNHVLNNDTGLDPTAATCAGIPSFETAEGFDCGEGIHLMGVDHSQVVANLVERNAGGILLSDDTGATFENLIARNTVQDNPYDCGITLASHPPAALTGSPSPLGVHNNTIAGNQSSGNGLGIGGAGAGVGIFDSIPGTKNYGNVVVRNRLTGNGLPGVTMHSHAPGQNLTDNVIAENYIAGNHADTEDAATPGRTGINVFGRSAASGTVISQNVIEDEDDDIVTNTPALVTVHLNNLKGGNIGLANIGAGSVDATENWWGCAKGPGVAGCSSVSGPNVVATPWLTTPLQSITPPTGSRGNSAK